MKTVRDILLWVALLAGGVCAFGQAERRVLRRGTELEYPAMAVQMNLHGTVKLKVWITPDGTVRRLEYVGGHPLLAESALTAVKNWKYEPGPKETTQIAEVRF